MSKKKEDLDYQKAEEMAFLIKKNVEDIIAVAYNNIDPEDIYTGLAVYSSLLAVANYMEYKMKEEGISLDVIESTKNSAENYALNLISEEKNLGVQKKGEA